MTIGERIKQKRVELGMSQEELAFKCGYKSRSSINKIELARDLPLNKVSKVASALGVNPGYIMGWDEEVKEAPSIEFDQDLMELIENYNAMSDEHKKLLLDYSRVVVNNYKGGN